MAYAPKPSFSKEQPDQVVIQNRVPKQGESDFTGNMPGSGTGSNATFRLVNPASTTGTTATTAQSTYPTGYSSGMPLGVDTQSGPGAAYTPAAGSTTSGNIAGNTQTTPGLVSDTNPWQYRNSAGGSWVGQTQGGQPVYTADESRYNVGGAQQAGGTNYSTTSNNPTGGYQNLTGDQMRNYANQRPSGIDQSSWSMYLATPAGQQYMANNAGTGGGGAQGPGTGYNPGPGQPMPPLGDSTVRNPRNMDTGGNIGGPPGPTSGGGAGGGWLTVGNPNGMSQQRTGQPATNTAGGGPGYLGPPVQVNSGAGVHRPGQEGRERNWRQDQGLRQTIYPYPGTGYPFMGDGSGVTTGAPMDNSIYRTTGNGPSSNGGGNTYPPGADYEPPIKHESGGGGIPGARPGLGRDGRTGPGNFIDRNRMAFYHPSLGWQIDPNSPYAQPGYGNPQGQIQGQGGRAGSPPPWLGGGGGTAPLGGGQQPPWVPDDPQNSGGGADAAMYGRQGGQASSLPAFPQFDPTNPPNPQQLAQIMQDWYQQFVAATGGGGQRPPANVQNPIQNPTWGSPWPGWQGNDLRNQPPSRPPTTR